MRLFNFVETAAARPRTDVLFKLDDPDVDAELASKYEHFEDWTIADTKIKEVYSYVAAQLASKELVTAARGYGLSYYQRNQINPDYNGVAKALAGGLSKYFNMTDNTVELRVPLSQLNVEWKAVSSPTKEETDARNKALKTLRFFLPNFAWPAAFEVKDHTKAGIFKPVKNYIFLEDIVKNKFDTTTYEGQTAPNMADYRPFNKTLALAFETKFVKAGNYSYNSDEKEGKIDETRDDLQLWINVALEIRLPLEYALWATSSTKMSEFSPHAIWKVLNSQVQFWCAVGKTNVKALQRINNLTSVKADTEYYLKEHGVKPIRKTNEDNLCITTSGEVVYIPEVDNLDHYIKEQGKLWDKEKKAIIPPDEVESLINMPLRVDWLTDKYFYTGTTGSIQMVDLLGAMPLDNATIGRFYSKPVDNGKLNDLFRVIRIAKENNPNLFEFGHAFNLYGLTWGNLCGEPYVSPRGTSDVYLDDSLARMGKTFQYLADNFDKLSISQHSRIHDGFYIFLLGKYGKKRATLEKTYREKLEANLKPAEASEKPTLYGLPGVNGFLPHQAQVYADLTSASKDIIVGVPPGGGKTLLSIADIAEKLATKKCKRPCVIMPGGLIKQYCNSVSNFSKGNLRSFVINLRIWRHWTEDLKLSYPQIIALIQSQPENTIFITDYNFLGHGADWLGFEEHDFVFYPKANLFANIGIDLVVYDEVQKIKNQTSARAQAASAAFSLVENKRPMTGTLVTNVGYDLIGIVGAINPAAASDEINKHYDKANRGAVSLKKVAIVNKAIAGAAKKATAQRRDWSYLLPNPNEQVHFVEMTINQKLFYDNALRKTLEEVSRDTKLMKLIREGDQEAESAVENALQRYFAKLEAFINAPDSDGANTYGPVFSNLENVNEDDLVSPKVKEVDRLINLHMNGGKRTVVNAEGNRTEVDLPPDSSKILVFSYNKAVSVHLFKHTKYKNIAVRYSAGDEDAITAFMNDPKIKVMFCDETSVQEGRDFQIASRLIRIQTLWAGGAQEQSLSRILRPDVPDASGKTKYNRSAIHLDTIVTQNTLEISKLGRMIYKIIERVKIEEGEDNISLRQMLQANSRYFERMKRLSMSLDALVKYSNSSDLADYFHCYTIFKAWEDREFANARVKLKEKVEKRLGKKITMEELPLMAMTPVEHKELAGAKKGGYTPWVPGVPPTDKYGLNLQPLSIVMDSDDEDSDDGVIQENEDARVSVGDLVMTEYGPGFIEKLRKGSSTCFVKVPGFSKVGIRLNRAVVYVPKNEKKALALKEMLKAAGERGLPTLRLSAGKFINDTDNINAENLEKLESKAVKPKVQPKKINLAPPSVEEKPAKATRTPATKPVKVKTFPYSFSAGMYNNQLAIWVFAGGDADNVLVLNGWHRIGKTSACNIQNYRGLLNIIKLLQEKFVVPTKHLRSLESFAELLKTNKGQVSKIKPKDMAIMKSFYLDNARKPADKMEIHPYIFIEGEDILLYINTEVSPAARSLTRLTKVVGASKFEAVDSWLIKFVSTKAKALAEIEALAKKNIVMDNKREFDKEFKLL